MPVSAIYLFICTFLLSRVSTAPWEIIPFFQRKSSFPMRGHDSLHTQCALCIRKTCLPRITFGLNVLWIQFVYRSVQAIWLQIMRGTLKRLFHHADIRACTRSTFPWCRELEIERNARWTNTRARQWEMTKLMSDIGDKLPNR